MAMPTITGKQKQLFSNVADLNKAPVLETWLPVAFAMHIIRPVEQNIH